MSHDINDKGDFDAIKMPMENFQHCGIRTNAMEMRCPFCQYSKLFNCSVVVRSRQTKYKLEMVLTSLHSSDFL